MEVPHLTDPQISFRPLESDDFPLIRTWMSRPHVSRWWGNSRWTEDLPRQIDGSDPARPWVVLHGSRPVGFCQDYLLGDDEYGRAIDLPESTVALDLYVGEEDLIGTGFGPRMIRRFLDLHVWSRDEVSGFLIAPSVENAASIRAAQKAGLEYLRDADVPGPDGPEAVVYMPRPEPLVLCLRHGLSEGNRLKVWQGQSEWPISEEGREQARAAAESLRGFVGPVYTSPLSRCVETADIVCGILGLEKPIQDPGLLEVNAGGFSGKTKEQVAESYPKEFADWRAGRLVGFPEGETRAEHSDRMAAAVSRLAHAHPGRKVLAFTHGGSLSAIERACDSWTEGGHPNLAGRWFAVDPLRPASERFRLVDESASHTQH